MNRFYTYILLVQLFSLSVCYSVSSEISQCICNMTDANKINPFYYSLSGDTEEDKKLLEPIRYIHENYGKNRFLSKIILAFNYWFKILPNKFRKINEIVDLAYTFVLTFDDIQDNAIFRENVPVAHHIYGLSNTVNAGNYITMIAMERIVNLQHSAAKIYIEELLNYNRGQGMDMFWKDNFICPTETEYKTMAIKKICWSMNLAVRLMKLFSTYGEDLSSLVTTIGLYYQIRNDYCNLCIDEENKNYCDDLTEGKFGFPVVHALTSNPDDRQIINILRQRTKDIEMKRHCIKLLEKYGSFKYTRNVLEELDSAARAKIERLGGNPPLVKFLDEFKNLDIIDAPKDSLTETF